MRSVLRNLYLILFLSPTSHYKEPSPACHCDEQQPLPPAQQSYELRFDDPVTQRCSKREDVCKAYVLVKVSKTGTTTLCTILSRYLHLNNLTMITPASGYAIQWWRSRNSGTQMVSGFTQLTYYKSVTVIVVTIIAVNTNFF